MHLRIQRSIHSGKIAISLSLPTSTLSACNSGSGEYLRMELLLHKPPCLINLLAYFQKYILTFKSCILMKYNIVIRVKISNKMSKKLKTTSFSKVSNSHLSNDTNFV